MTAFVRAGRSCLSLFLLVLCLPRLYCWSLTPWNTDSLQKTRRFTRAFHHALFSSTNNDDNSDIRRISIAGASVSPTGFWVVLDMADNQYWPVQVTSSQEDTAAATSIESLTLLQLISGVDMAGPILPPEVLSQLAVIHAENNKSDNSLQALSQQLKLPDGIPYSELNEWQKSKLRLPQVTLDGVIVTINEGTTQWTLQCASPDASIGSFDFSPQICQVDRDNAIAVAFASIALALRYHAPLTLQQQQDNTLSLYTLNQIQTKFPLYNSVEQLKKPANRVQSNLQRGFEIHKLTGALKLAMERGDEDAAERIREALDKYDSMDDLPISPQFETSDYDQLQ